MKTVLIIILTSLSMTVLSQTVKLQNAMVNEYHADGNIYVDPVVNSDVTFEINDSNITYTRLYHNHDSSDVKVYSVLSFEKTITFYVWLVELDGDEFEFAMRKNNEYISIHNNNGSTVVTGRRID